ncbi:hypothetical protein ABKN59_000688 [Abortiporus biennis]
MSTKLSPVSPTHRGQPSIDPSIPVTMQATPPVQPPESPATQRFARKPLRRSASRIRRWVQDQQTIQSAEDPDTPPESPDCETPSPTSGCHPYLAYPHLCAPLVSRGPQDDNSASDFVLVENSNVTFENQDFKNVTRKENASLPPTPRKRVHTLQTSNIFGSPPIRNIHLTFTHSRKPSNSTTVTATTASNTPSRTSIFRRTTTSDSTSLVSGISSTSLGLRPGCATPTTETHSRHNGRSTWTSKRPSVLGHFPISEGQLASLDDVMPLPRPSTSSRSSETTFALNSDAIGGTGYMSPPAPPRLPFVNGGTIRSHSPGSMFRSSPSLWSLPTNATHMNDPPDSTKIIAKNHEEKASVRTSIRTHVGPSTGLSSLIASPRRKKKRKLIISGVPLNDQRRYEGAKKWCESFGEIASFTRIANGDLHVDFRSAEVADTVCRLNAGVYISGVGSVGLSWFTGKKP